MKTCPRCRRSLPVTAFGTHARPERIPGKRYINSRCKECCLATYDPKAQRNRSLIKRYGITSGEFDQLFAAQGFRCAACGSQRTDGKFWHIDHDHATGRIRAILCHGCNTGLGNLDENPARIRALLGYAEKYCV